MRYDFTIILDEIPPDPPDSWLIDLADAFYIHFQGDATPAIVHGQAELGCTLEASSMEAALRKGRNVVQELGLRIRRIEIAPDAIPEAT